MMAGFLAFFFFLPMVGYAQNDERPIPAESPVYEWLAELFAAQGQTLPTRFGPSTTAQIKWELSLLDRSSLDPALENLYTAIENQITPRPILYAEGAKDGFAGRIGQQFNPEAYSSVGSAFLPWFYGYNDRPPLYSLSLEGWFQRWAWATFDLNVQKGYFVDLDQSQPISNFPGNVGELDFQWPDWAGLVIGGKHWDLRFLRGKVRTQAGFTNAALSTDLGVVDQIGFSTWWKGFTYTFLTIPFSDYPIDPSQTYYGGYYKTASTDQQASQNANGGNEFTPATTTYYILHRLDFRLFEKLTLTVNEILLVNMASFDPQYFNPFYPGHNWLLQSNANSDISLDVDWAAFPGLNLYGQIYGDYIRTAFKNTEYSDKNPLAMAYLLGARRVWTAQGAVWTFQAEGTYADPFLYLNPDVSAIYYQRYQSTYDGSNGHGIFIIPHPFGLATGPDAITGTLKLTVERARNWKLSLATPFTAQGENSVVTTPPTLQYLTPDGTTTTTLNPLYGTSAYLGWVSPTGTPTYTQQFILSGELGPDLLQNTWFSPWGAESSLGLSLDFAIVWNQNHTVSGPVGDLQTALTWKNRW
jgi:hypothetical protein